MADKKISQLTGATTPLAGTEVLPIVQSGSTVKVASDDLTVKNVRSNATTGILQITGPAAASTRVMTTPDANFTAARTDAGQTFTGTQTLTTTGNSIAVFNSTNANGGYVQVQKSGAATGFIGTGYELFSPAGSSTDLGIRAQDNLVFSAGGGTEGFRLNTSGNIVIKTAAKGIEFSANTAAAGMTSELLDWYEEGTFTPSFSGTTTGFTSITFTRQNGYYTRIGNLVYVSLDVAVSALTAGSPSGDLVITGLPFTVTNSVFNAATIATAGGYNTNQPCVGQFRGGTTQMRIYYRTSANGAVSAMDVAELSSTSTIVVSGFYFV